MTRTVVISDLHLGVNSGADLLARPDVREVLCEHLRGAERLVLLGDVVELRERRLDEALTLATPVLEAIGEALGDAEVIVCPGNHDYHLDPWIEHRRVDPGAPALGLAERREPHPGGPLGRLAAAMPECRVQLAYPGLWLRDDVYATHGHYLDLHTTTPTFEIVAASVLRRTVGSRDPAAPDDYEAALAPLYALVYSLAQGRGSRVASARASAVMWERLTAGRLRTLLFGGVALPAFLKGLSFAGLGPFKADLRPEQLGRAGVEAMHEVVERLGIDAPWVIYGHTHRAGPIPSDPPDWGRRGPTRLVNAGSWVYERGIFGSPRPGSPWFPGVVIEVGPQGPPQLRSLLEEGDPGLAMAPAPSPQPAA